MEAISTLHGFMERTRAASSLQLAPSRGNHTCRCHRRLTRCGVSCRGLCGASLLPKTPLVTPHVWPMIQRGLQAKQAS